MEKSGKKKKQCHWETLEAVQEEPKCLRQITAFPQRCGAGPGGGGTRSASKPMVGKFMLVPCHLLKRRPQAGLASAPPISPRRQQGQGSHRHG